MKASWCILQNKCRGLVDPFGYYSNNVFEVFDKSKEARFSLVFSILRRIPIIKNKVPYFLGFSSDWKTKIKDYDNFIIFYDAFAESVAAFIKKRNPNAHCYAYSWDIKYIPKQSTFFDKIGTFDENQAKNYGLNFYSQFYGIKNLTNETKLDGEEYSFCLLARKKNRENVIKQIKEECDSYDKNSYFKIIENNSKGAISYFEYLDIVKKSKCLIDIVVEGQSGLSLRPMEALFFEKKLVTNNVFIKNYDFYDDNNIFIYGIDNDLTAFMQLPYKAIDDAIKYKYTLDGFVEKIINQNKER